MRVGGGVQRRSVFWLWRLANTHRNKFMVGYRDNHGSWRCPEAVIRPGGARPVGASDSKPRVVVKAKPAAVLDACGPPGEEPMAYIITFGAVLNAGEFVGGARVSRGKSECSDAGALACGRVGPWIWRLDWRLEHYCTVALGHLTHWDDRDVLHRLYVNHRHPVEP